MTGECNLSVYDSKVHYDLCFRRNITLLRGNSATGKTTLLEMVQSWAERGTTEGIVVRCSVPIVLLAINNWRAILDASQNSLVFADEFNDYLRTKEFANRVKHSTNYFCIICRDPLPMLPYSVNEVYGLREDGKYRGTNAVYNVMYSLVYGENAKFTVAEPDLIITEDKKSGYQFFNSLGTPCISAEGKSNIARVMEENADKTLYIVADGAAFGSEIERVLKVARGKRISAFLCLYESFEWLVLKSGVVPTNISYRHILEHPVDFIASEKFESWE